MTLFCFGIVWERYVHPYFPTFGIDIFGGLSHRTLICYFGAIVRTGMLVIIRGNMDARDSIQDRQPFPGRTLASSPLSSPSHSLDGLGHIGVPGELKLSHLGKMSISLATRAVTVPCGQIAEFSGFSVCAGMLNAVSDRWACWLRYCA